MVFTGHFGPARGHLFLLFLGALRPKESLVLPRLDEETENSFFTERFGGFQTMQAFNEHEPSAVHPYQDRCLLALVEHARGDFVHALARRLTGTWMSAIATVSRFIMPASPFLGLLLSN
jgi:hypothetical protein